MFESISMIGPFCFMIMVAVPLMLTGLLSRKDVEEVGNNRDSAMLLSFLPPMGHRYLGCWKKGMPVAIAFLMSIFLLGSSVFFVLEGRGPHDGDTVSLMMYGMWTLVFSWMWLSLEVNEICNRLNLGHDNGFFEMKVKKTYLWMLSLSFFMIAVILISSAFLSTEGYLVGAESVIYPLISTAPAIYLIVKTLNGRRCRDVDS